MSKLNITQQVDKYEVNIPRQVVEEAFIILRPWMVNELQLELTPLTIYAVVYSMTQDSNSYYYSNSDYIHQWTGLNERTIQRHLNTLVEEGLLEKQEVRRNGAKVVYGYRYSYEGRMSYIRRTKCTSYDVQNVRGNDVQNVLHISKSNINKNNISKRDETSPQNKLFNKPKNTPKQNGQLKDVPYLEIIQYLNELANKKYKPDAKETIELINKIWAEGYTLDDFKYVIANKCKEWLDPQADSCCKSWVRPSTLFKSPSKFDEYLNEEPYKSSTGKQSYQVPGSETDYSQANNRRR